MPRKSASALSVAPDPVELDRRMPPPEELTQIQAQIWNSVVATKPADWLQADSAALLVAYCKHITTARFIDQYIDAFESGESVDDDLQLKAYSDLLDKREKQTRIITSVATKLRLTPQSRYDEKAAHTANKKTKGTKLWERDGLAKT